MMRLIDADDARKWASEHILDAKERYGILDFLRDCETIDAVEVVRCGKCKYYDECTNFLFDDDYCSRGERK